MSALPSHEIEKFLRMFLNLPPGAFLMGNDRPVTEWDGTVRAEHQRNGPERMVSIERPFAIMSAPVSVAAFLAVKHDAMMATPVFRLPDSGIVDAPWPTVPFALANRNPACPVVGVSWEDATAFCEALSMLLARRIRLPSEIEWEYACRAGTRSLYHWGDNVRDADAFAWYDLNAEAQVRASGLKLPNQWGLFDMTGNIWEWCNSDLQSVGRVPPQRHPIRGGSSCHHATSLRSAHGFHQRSEQRNAYLGFRCVMESGR